MVLISNSDTQKPLSRSCSPADEQKCFDKDPKEEDEWIELKTRITGRNLPGNPAGFKTEMDCDELMEI